MSAQKVVARIDELFVVSPEDALSCANEFLELVSSHGGVVTQQVIDKQVPNVFGDRLTWRNDKKQVVEKDRETTIKSYNEYLNSKRK